MKTLLRFFWRARGHWLERAAEKEIVELKDGVYRLPYNIPYVSQYASAERAEEFVGDENLLQADARWRESGAETLDEYVFWAPKLCGMACFKMILLSLRRPTSKLAELGKTAMAAGCYKKNLNKPNQLIGLLHAPFLKFAKNFDFAGKLLWYIGPAVIAQEILNKNFVIASVSRDIRHAGALPKDKIGHLVLVHGFEIKNGKISGFYIHNPSGFYNESQENHFVPVEDFIGCFSGRIIVLKI